MTDRSFNRVCKQQVKKNQEHKRTITENAMRANERFHRSNKAVSFARDAFHAPETVLLAHLQILNHKDSIPNLAALINIFVDPLVWLDSFVPTDAQVAELKLMPSVPYTTTVQKTLVGFWMDQFSAFLRLPLPEMLARVPMLLSPPIKNNDHISATRVSAVWLPILFKLTNARVFQAASLVETSLPIHSPSTPTPTPKPKRKKSKQQQFDPAASSAVFAQHRLGTQTSSRRVRRLKISFNNHNSDLAAIRKFTEASREMEGEDMCQFEERMDREAGGVLTTRQRIMFRAFRAQKHTVPVTSIAMASAFEQSIAMFCEQVRSFGPGIESLAKTMNGECRVAKLLASVCSDIHRDFLIESATSRVVNALSLRDIPPVSGAIKEEKDDGEEQKTAKKPQRRRVVRLSLVRLEHALCLREFLSAAEKNGLFGGQIVMRAIHACQVACQRLVDQEMQVIPFMFPDVGALHNLRHANKNWIESYAGTLRGAQFQGSTSLSEAIRDRLNIRPPSFDSIAFIDLLPEVLSLDSAFKKVPIIHAFTKLKPLPGQHRMLKNVIRPYMHAVSRWSLCLSIYC